MATKSTTITSDAVISLPDMSEIMIDAWSEISSAEEFQKQIIYKRINMDEDNITGDLDESNNAEYDIYAEVQSLNKEHKLVKIGEMQVGDAEVFLPARIDIEVDETAITEFRPQLNDMIQWNSTWYVIKKILPERVGAIEIYLTCLCKKIDNIGPTTAWNNNYDEYEDSIGGGGWS